MLFFLLIIFCITPTIWAKNLGTVGATYPIIEQDFLEFIHIKLKRLEQDGQITALRHKMEERAQQYIDRPPPLLHITRTKTPRSWLFDPTLKLQHDLKDHTGKLFAPVGTVVNPLATIALHSTLLFYNADDPDQVKWAQKTHQAITASSKSHKNPRTPKLILTNGSLLAQIKLLQQPLYFDQQGRLTARFGIQHVPAMVTQENLQLRVTEVLP